MSVELVTGYSGVGGDGQPNRHVSSADDGARQAGTVGTGMYVLGTGAKMSATMEDANTLVVADGDAMINGRHVRIPDTLSFTIPTGVQGQKVSNIAVLRYSKAADSVESVAPVVLTGEPSTGTPTDPALSEGSVLDGDSPVDMPLYRVVTDGINAGEPERLFRTVNPLGAAYVTLWEGSFGSGSITVPGLSDYHLLIIEGRTRAMLCVVGPSYVCGVMGLTNSTPGQVRVFGAAFTRSGDRLSYGTGFDIVDCRGNSGDVTAVESRIPVTRIIGLI